MPSALVPSALVPCALLLACALLAGCGDSGATAGRSLAYQTSAPSTTQSVRQDRGQVVSTTPGHDSWTSQLPGGTRVTRITYRSTSGVDGSGTTVSGAVFVPQGAWPSGGWPLIAYAHGTTGLTRDCAPSDQPDMFGDLRAVSSFLTSGYAVVTTDYQGLGVRTDERAAHPYLEPRTAAYNVIDAVRAARSLEPTIGDRWVASGASQGGAAAWATAEEASSYGGGSGRLGSGQLVGAVAVAPVLDVSYLVDRAHDGTLTPAQRSLYPLVVAGAAQTDASVRPADYLHGISEDRRQALVSCRPGRTALAGQGTRPDPSMFTPTSLDARRTLQALLARFALPRTRTSVPILAVYGSADDIIPAAVMERTLGDGCAIGDDVTRVRRQGQGHTVEPGPVLGEWIHDRMVGIRSQSNC